MSLGQRAPKALRRAALVLCLAGITAGFYYEVAFRGRTFLPGSALEGVMGYAPPWQFRGEIPEDLARPDRAASSWIYAPQMRAVARAWAQGRAPLWTPSQGLGAPLAAGALAGAFDWLRIPLVISQRPLAWDLYHLGLTLLAMVLTWCYASAIGLLPWARVLAAVAYAFSGFLVLYGNNSFVEVYVMLPGLLLGVELLLSGRSTLGVVFTTLVVATATLAGMPESTLMVFLYASGYGVCRLVGLARVERSWRVLVGMPARLMALASALGLALAAPLLLPLAEYVANAHHLHGPEKALGLHHLPVWDAVRLAFPFLGEAAPAFAVTQIGYSGAVVVVLALVGAFSARRSTPAMAHLIVVGIFLAKFLGLPLLNEVGRLPILILTIIPKWGASCLAFGLAMLAASAVNAAERRLLRPRSVAWAAACFLLIHTFLCLGHLHIFESGPSLRQTLLVLGASAFTAFVAILMLRVRLRWISPAPALAVLVFVELFALAPHGIYATRYDPLTEPPFVRFLLAEREKLGPHRLLGLGGVLYPNTATAYGLEDLRSLDALYPSRYFEFLRRFISPTLFDRYTGVAGAESRTRVGGNPWLDAAGVRFVIMPHESGPDGRRFGIGRFLDQFELVYREEVDIYENRRALPRAWLTGQVQVVRDRSAAAEVAEARGFDPTLQVVVEIADPVPVLPEANGLARPLAGSVEVVGHEPERVRFVTHANSAALLVVAEQYFPGWEATVDGVATAIYPTNIAFRGVVVPEGTHEVTFRYRPASYRYGVALAFASALVLAAVVLVLRQRRNPSLSAQPTASV